MSTTHTPGRKHVTIMPGGRRIEQWVRGICKFDVLNPCWDNRPDDITGQHWGGPEFQACEPCTRAAIAKAEAAQ